MNGSSNHNGDSANTLSIQSSSYVRVLHKKKNGTLILTDPFFTFYITGTNDKLEYAWDNILKHQVSPETHPKHLLKIILQSVGAQSKKKSLTYEFESRNELEKIRKDISSRLTNARKINALNAQNSKEQSRKRKLDLGSEQSGKRGADNAMDEHDFWSTHSKQVSNQCAKIHGFVARGIPSAMKSSLDIQIQGNVSKPIKLGVEEMRQIFIMYPAVHDAYEEKVPLELSEEQFWRKYLESEFFHRDRGRIGVSAKQIFNSSSATNETTANEADGDDDKDGNEKEGDDDGKDEENAKKALEEDNKVAKEREESARMGAASSNDIFSRKEIELQQRQKRMQKNRDKTTPSKNNVAIGQFDLLATINTERGSKLLLNSNDLHPFDDRGKKVIEKYNRHWAMVLNPDDACAGCDLSTLARNSSKYTLEDDDDAKVNGGSSREMTRLVGFASTDSNFVDHVKGIGRQTKVGANVTDDEERVRFEELKLNNLDAYEQGMMQNKAAPIHSSNSKDQDAMFAKVAKSQVNALLEQFMDRNKSADESNTYKIQSSLPDSKFGKNLLMALTNHMIKSSMTEKDTVKMTKALPEKFRNDLISYTRRSHELLRHFFALRYIIGKDSSKNSKSSQKLKKIVQSLEVVYREMESMRKELPQGDLGEQMRKMCLPIMDQLDWAFKLNREHSGIGGGGFVTVT
ncbi:hypothetical protein CTEN210_01917 [Chaetoceros tenuissimus]|uniref:BSD domain-containing protein n=1 Tax=Chaetoceros tenuissimus TaxID=426638 RepID=A0AAD3CGJ7_9STRA|nr:hypothetical protein CTEN210_01917 [Chaetoceros tenuissimus]